MSSATLDRTPRAVRFETRTPGSAPRYPPCARSSPGSKSPAGSPRRVDVGGQPPAGGRRPSDADGQTPPIGAGSSTVCLTETRSRHCESALRSDSEEN